MKRLALMLLCLAQPALAQAPPPASPVPPPSLAPSPSFPETWLARANFDLVGLDKITARVTALSGQVGKPVTFGTLSITVRSCIVRAADQPADQAAFFDVIDSRNPAFAFHGWMLLSAPGDSIIEHPVYDVRLAACRP